MSDQTSDTAQPGVELAPVANAERIDVLDILRGFALIGILLMNIEWFGRPVSEIGTFDTDLSGLDHAVGWLIRFFVEGKFYKLFALLFGMGFAVMLIRAREKGRPFTAWFVRRMVVLFFIGILHMLLLWDGDILHDYAFAGLLFLGLILLVGRPRFARFDRPETFLKVGIYWLMLPIIMASVFGFGFGVLNNEDSINSMWLHEKAVQAQVITLEEEAPTADDAEDALAENPDSDESDSDDVDEEDLTPEELQAKDAQETFERQRERDARKQDEIDALSKGSYWQATQFRFEDSLRIISATPMFAVLILLPIFLLGYWLIASGVVRNHREHAQLFRYLARVGWGFGVAFTVAGLLLTQHPVAEQIELVIAVGSVLFLAGQYLMTIGYLGSIVLLTQHERWHHRFKKLVPMGRMALTNYIMQTVILVCIFHGYAGGLYGQVSRAPQMLIVIAIVFFQILFSAWWLTRYRFGPLEWVWRCLTYKQWQAMRIEA